MLRFGGCLLWFALVSTAWASSASATPCDARTDPVRIRAHLERAEAELAARDTSGWDIASVEARRRNLAVLRAYIEAESFPRNRTAPGLLPVFVDHAGRHCAVAYLMRASGAGDLVDEVASRDNNAYLLDLTDPRLDAWIAASGLSQHELAWIQPSYCPNPCTPPGDYLCSSSACVGDPQTGGSCVDNVEDDGTPCGTATVCASGTCQAGHCVYEELDCDDGDETTIDTCEEPDGCRHEPADQPCEGPDGCKHEPVPVEEGCSASGRSSGTEWLLAAIALLAIRRRRR